MMNPCKVNSAIKINEKTAETSQLFFIEKEKIWQRTKKSKGTEKEITNLLTFKKRQAYA